MAALSCSGCEFETDGLDSAVEHVQELGIAHRVTGEGVDGTTFTIEVAHPDDLVEDDEEEDDWWED